ncbi:hypothetical protein J3Q64DRAFT_1708615 [Phycomyces blakesleeanus]|uniref:Uncharacterized protein n=1 Tax=Phycomyces blakesleeanus TaxID=4837 RepID=A0ABR3BCW9_PHYBL
MKRIYMHINYRIPVMSYFHCITTFILHSVICNPLLLSLKLLSRAHGPNKAQRVKDIKRNLDYFVLSKPFCVFPIPFCLILYCTVMSFFTRLSISTG